MRIPGEQRPATVSKTKQTGETPNRKWEWVERTVWTDRMLEALDKGVKGGNTLGTLGVLAFTMPIVPCSSPREVNRRPESRMREIRMSGSEGGEPG